MITKCHRLDKEAKAWLKRKSGPDEIIRIVPTLDDYRAVTTYNRILPLKTILIFWV